MRSDVYLTSREGAEPLIFECRTSVRGGIGGIGVLDQEVGEVLAAEDVGVSESG